MWHYCFVAAALGRDRTGCAGVRRASVPFAFSVIVVFSCAQTPHQPHLEAEVCLSNHQTSVLWISFSKLPSWARAVVPKIFYVTEKAWNYYPYTITGEVPEISGRGGVCTGFVLARWKRRQGHTCSFRVGAEGGGGCAGVCLVWQR